MSVKVSSWVFEHSTVEHRGDLLVLLVLADHAHDDGTSAYPSVGKLAEKARLTRRGAQLALRRLEDLGAIEDTGRKGPKGTIEYRVVMDGAGRGAKPLRSEATSRANSETRGGEVGDTPGANSPSPEPSIEPSEEPSDPPEPPQAGESTNSGGPKQETLQIGHGGSTLRVVQLEEPPSEGAVAPAPPKGNRDRDRKSYEAELATFAGRHWPGRDVPGLSGYIAHEAAALRMRRHVPTVAALRPLVERYLPAAAPPKRAEGRAS